MVKVVSGQFQYEAITTSPADANTYLQNNKEMSPTVINTLFMDYTPDAINFSGCVFDEAASDALCQELAKCMTVAKLSFEGVTGKLNFTNIFNALVENLSVQCLHIPALGTTLAKEDVCTLVENLIPYNRTIVEWNFTDNEIGDDGLLQITSALEKTASVQRISFKNAGGSTGGIERLLQAIKALPCLVQLDVRGNGPISSSVLGELDQTLHQNLKLLHPTSEATHERLVGGEAPAAPQEEKKEETTTEAPKTEEQRQTSPPQPANGTPSRGRGSSRTTATTKPASPTPAGRKRHGTIKRDSKPPVGVSSTRSTPQHASPVARDEPEPTKPASEKREPEQVQHDKREAPQQQSTRRVSRTNSRTNSPAPQGGNTPQRDRSRTSTPGPYAASPSRARARSSTPIQRDVNDGVEEWKEVRHHYNQYIKDPNAKAVPINRSQPKYVLGKRVDQIRERPSSSFSRPQMRTRTPTPQEIRKYAPWNQKDGPRTVGTQHHVIAPGEEDAANPTVISFQDGGDISSIREDPRDIGYKARKMQAGQLNTKSSSVFASNSPREVRWGTKATQQVTRQAQAPGPGYYSYESEWEKNARKLKEQQARCNSKGQRFFGTSGAPRNDKKHVADGPGPGSYEIP